MVDTLRCEEVLTSTPNVHFLGTHPASWPHFCHAYRDPVILDDHRVFRNLLTLEHFYKVSNEHYHSVQDEIKLHMRKVVAEWMLEVCIDQRRDVEVFLLATNIMDRFLQTGKLRKNQFQLLGAGALFLASKMIEPEPMAALTLVRFTADTYDCEELLTMELRILARLQWDLSAVTSYDYLDHLLNVLQNPSGRRSQDTFVTNKSPGLLASSDSIRLLSERLVTLCATHFQFIELPPSLVSTAALVSAIREDRTAVPQSGVNLNQVISILGSYSSYEKDTVMKCVELIGSLILSSSGCVKEAADSSSSGLNESDLMVSSSSSGLCDNEQRSALNATPTEVFSIIVASEHS